LDSIALSLSPGGPHTAIHRLLCIFVFVASYQSLRRHASQTYKINSLFQDKQHNPLSICLIGTVRSLASLDPGL
jgi:hypothetical protein